jgi:transcriptional regulator with XRE-family HTH domain
MDRWRFGRLIRALRQRRHWRQEDLAARAGISRSVVGRVERGELSRTAWGDVVAIAEAVGARAEPDLRWEGERIDRLLDERHAATSDVLVRFLRRWAWTTDVEVSFSIFGERGSIDVVGRRPEAGLIAIFEVKASIGDANQTLIGIDRKTRLALAIARERGWAAHGIARFLVVADGSTARGRVARHAAVFEAAFPMRGRDCARWLRDPTGRPPSGLFFLRVPDVRSTGTTKQRIRRLGTSTVGTSAAK